MATKQDQSTLNNIIAWAKQHIEISGDQATILDINKNFTKTTKQTLALYIQNLVDAYQHLNKQFEANADSLDKANAELQQSHSALQKLNEKLQKTQKQQTTLDAQLVGKQKKESELLNRLDAEQQKINTLKRQIDNLETQNKKLHEAIKDKNIQLERAQEEMHNREAPNDEKAMIGEQLRNFQQKLGGALKKPGLLSNENKIALLNETIEQLILENNRLLAIAASNSNKHGEHIRDYEKRENYQIVKEFKEFCLRQGLDFLAEEILMFKQSPDSTFNEEHYKLRLLEMKSSLVEKLLILPYHLQVRQLRNQRPLIGFKAFKDNHELLAVLDETNAAHKELLKVAEKGFDLICELINVTPPCQLLVPEVGTQYHSEEHDVDELFSRPAGMIKLILAPGVCSGHNVLMKPVVYTQ